MIQIIAYKSKFAIVFRGKNFSETLEACKKHYLTYEPQTHYWLGSKKQIIGAKVDLDLIEDVVIDDITKKDLEIKSELKYYPVTLNRQAFVKPAIKGKSPNEKYQIEEVKKGIEKNAHMYALEMGLGKSFCVVTALNHHWLQNRFDKLLILCPSEGLYNWINELKKFSLFGKDRDLIYVASVNNREPFQDKHRINIMTYRSYMMFSDNKYKELNGKKSKNYRNPPLELNSWGNSCAVIYDESHALKHPTSRTSKIVKLHNKFFNFRYELTGTPDARGVEGYYNQIEMLDEAIIPESFLGFKSKIAHLGNRFSKVAIDEYKPDKVAEFIEDIKPFVSRRYSDDCIELPPKVIKKVYVELEYEHKQLYRMVIKERLDFLQQLEGFLNPQTVKNNFPYIRQAIDNPFLLQDKDSFINQQPQSKELKKTLSKWKFDKHAKVEALDSLVDRIVNEEEEKVIIWDFHPLTLNQLAERYKKHGPLVLHGEVYKSQKTKDKEKHDIIEKFKKSKKHKILIASSLVLNSAINLVECRYSIYFSRNDNLEHFLQSMKRIHRIGQTKRVIIYVLVALKTLDFRADRQLEYKEKINNKLFEKDNLSIDEWRDVFLGKDF